MKNTIIILTLALFGVLLWSCSEQRLEPEYSTHIEAWMDTTSADFHGKVAMADSNQGCVECHAQDIHIIEFDDVFSGGTSGVACEQCHTYPHGSLQGGSLHGHPSFIFALNWDMSGCANCHGNDFAGGRTGVSCLGCHTQEGGPANCTTCHGVPPVDDSTLVGSWVPLYRPAGAAGAHAFHVNGKGYACTECHDAVTDLSHTGPLPAEVTFSEASIAHSENYPATVSHLGELNSGNATCATYCHSNGRGGAPNQPVPEWTATVELTCNSCHSIPPVTPHPPGTDCQRCHSNVDPSSVYPDQIHFINEQLHVNGTVDL